MAKKYPDAEQRILGKQTQGKMTSHDIVCLHTMVGYLASTDTMFKSGGFSGTESHFGVGGAWGSDVSRGLDGKVYQWQLLSHRADANLYGNHRVISIETADNAPRSASDIAPWSTKQVAALIKLVSWLCSKEAHTDCPQTWECHKSGIPVALIPDTKPGRRGIAYHRQGVDPVGGAGTRPGYRVNGGELWSTARGKECPGTSRIAQISSVLIPGIKSLGKKDADVALTNDDKQDIAHAVVETLLSPKTKLILTAAEAEEMSSAGTPRKEGDLVSFRYFISWGGGGTYRLYRMVKALSAGPVVSRAMRAVYGADAASGESLEAATGSAPAGVSSWSPMVRHLLLMMLGTALSWVSTVLVPALSGQTGYGALLAALITAALAYLTPLIPSYGVGSGKVSRNLSRD